MNIVLIGFTSTGKSVTGVELAQRMKLGFVDLDREVEQAYYRKQGERLSCRDLYLQIGDQKFGSAERKALLEITSMNSDVVLSTGGKAPIRSGNADILGEWGTIIYLKSQPSIIFERMKAKGPPAYLEKGFCLDSLIEHWQERNPLYETMADLIIETDTLTVTSTVAKIAGLLTPSH